MPILFEAIQQPSEVVGRLFLLGVPEIGTPMFEKY
jgi:hypothetical protein